MYGIKYIVAIISPRATNTFSINFIISKYKVKAIKVIIPHWSLSIIEPSRPIPIANIESHTHNLPISSLNLSIPILLK